MTTGKAQETPKVVVATTAASPAASASAESASSSKELKIEVHATAVHLEPVVAHAQAHEMSHNQAVS